MPPPTIPKDLLAYLAAPTITSAHACDALEEWILSRRHRGDTLFDISVGLVELEEKTPPHLAPAFDRARYLTSLPEVTDLTPPTGVFPLHRSQSPATILAHLLSQPVPTLEHSREVILEYVLARETKARDKKPGRGGKGSLSREALEDISDRLTEVERGLMTMDGRRLELDELDEPRQLGMTLVLSLRMSLSYFKLQDLAQQLFKVPLGVGERMLVQHIRRRVAGEGRWAVGKELEYLESLALKQRPALRPAFRSAKARTLLPEQAVFPLALPAPSKSGCIKLIQSFATDTGVSPTGYFSRRGIGSSSDSSSPKSPTSPLPVVSTLQPSDPSRLAAYTQELLTEYLTREKRDYMLKGKWARTGREQLGKDFGDIEQALCLASKQQPGPLAPTLVPVCLVLRRTFMLPASSLPVKLVDAFADVLPDPPDADDIPFKEPSVQTATSSLYVNPRLADAVAFQILEELVMYEKEILDERDMGDGVPAALVQVIEYVEKRFPDGSYTAAFATAKALAANNVTPPVTATISKQPSMHRRTVSHVDPPVVQTNGYDTEPHRPQARQHSRSTSLPHRSNTMESDDDSDESIGIELTATHQMVDRPPVLPALSTDQPPILPPLTFASPIDAQSGAASGSASAGGWWDVVSAVQTQAPSAPWHDNVRSTTRKRTTSGGFSSLPVPPGAEPAVLPQSEPLLAQLQTLQRASPAPGSTQPAATTVPASLAAAPSPPMAPIGSSTGSPIIDFSKRHSDATLNEELGNLMISPDRATPTSKPATPSRDGLASTHPDITPVGPPRRDESTPLGASPRRRFPSQPGLNRAESDRARVLMDNYDSDDSDLGPSGERPPMPPFISPQQYRTIGQPSPRPSPQAAASPGHQQSPATTPNGTKPAKSRGWKSVSAAIGIPSKDKDKDKDKDRKEEKAKEKENDKVVRTGNRAWPENDPGRWNKNMVANIMGPPAERR